MQASLGPGTAEMWISGWEAEMCPDPMFLCCWPMLNQVHKLIHDLVKIKACRGSHTISLSVVE